MFPFRALWCKGIKNKDSEWRGGFYAKESIGGSKTYIIRYKWVNYNFDPDLYRVFIIIEAGIKVRVVCLLWFYIKKLERKVLVLPEE